MTLRYKMKINVYLKSLYILVSFFFFFKSIIYLSYLLISDKKISKKMKNVLMLGKLKWLRQITRDSRNVIPGHQNHKHSKPADSINRAREGRGIATNGHRTGAA